MRPCIQIPVLLIIITITIISESKAQTLQLADSLNLSHLFSPFAIYLLTKPGCLCVVSPVVWHLLIASGIGHFQSILQDMRGLDRAGAGGATLYLACMRNK
jgi:hypothetical protein